MLNVENHDLEKHLECLRQLIERSNAQDLFGVLLLHKHFKLQYGYHLAGNFGDVYGLRYYWTRTVADKTSDSTKLCGRKFMFIPGRGLRPYEFHQGILPNLHQVDPSFYSEFNNYLVEQNLTSIMGLEYIVPELSEIGMTEFVSPSSGLQILVQTTLPVLHQLLLVATGWRWPSGRIGISGEAVWCVKDKDTGKHKEI